MRCSSPRCSTERAEGSRFCAEHRNQFAAMAVEINESNVSWRRTGKRSPHKRCEATDCPELALPRENYCEQHLREIDG